jgi:hypothetical protein
MQEHGDYDLQARKWYCGYWMTEEQWFDIHDYAPPTLQEPHNNGSESSSLSSSSPPPASSMTADGDAEDDDEEE